MFPPQDTNKAVSLSHAQLCEAARAIYLARKNHIEQEKHGSFKRPPEWFSEQEGRLRELESIGKRLRFIADHAASYDQWEASIKGARP